MMQKTAIYLIALIFIILSGCGQNSSNKSNSNLPAARGALGEVILVIDSNMWNSEVGDLLREIYEPKVVNLPRPEKLFDLKKISPMALNSMFRNAKNLMYVTVLDDNSNESKKLRTNFTKESIKAIKEDPSMFMQVKKDEFAKGQEVIHLFGPTKEVLMKNLEINKERIRNHLLKVEMDRIEKEVYAQKPVVGIANHMERTMQCSFKVPKGYEIAIEGEDFIWIRSMDIEIDKSIFVTYVPYTSEDMFDNDKIIQFRDSIAKAYIFGDPERPETYMKTETEFFEVYQDEVNFRDAYSKRTKALWKTNNNSMGGPFISYAFVDEAQNRFYYIEGFLYSPGKSQRDLMRELEVVLNTFKTVKDS